MLLCFVRGAWSDETFPHRFELAREPATDEAGDWKPVQLGAGRGGAVIAIHEHDIAEREYILCVSASQLHFKLSLNAPSHYALPYLQSASSPFNSCIRQQGREAWSKVEDRTRLKCTRLQRERDSALRR